MEEFETKTLPTVLGYLEKLVAQTGKKGFAVGDSVSVQKYLTEVIETKIVINPYFTCWKLT